MRRDLPQGGSPIVHFQYLRQPAKYRRQALQDLTGPGLPGMTTLFYLGIVLGQGLTGVARWTEGGVSWGVSGMAGAFGAALVNGLWGGTVFFLAAWLTNRQRAGKFVAGPLPLGIGALLGLAVGIIVFVGGEASGWDPAEARLVGVLMAGIVGGVAWALLVRRTLPGPDPDEERLARMAPGSIRVKPRRDWRLRGARAELRRPAFGDVMMRFGVAFALMLTVGGIVAMVFAGSLDEAGLPVSMVPLGGFLSSLLYAVPPALLFWFTAHVTVGRKPLQRDLPRRGPEISGAATAVVPILLWLVLTRVATEATWVAVPMVAGAAITALLGARLWVRAGTRVPPSG